MAQDSIDRAIAGLAARQYGIVTREQLLALALGPTAISKRVRGGRLHRVHAGVYGVGRPPITALERAAAAVLACGPSAALCGPSAFTLWGLDKQWRFPVHVCSPVKRARPGIVTHRFPSLAKKDIRTQLGITVTSPARTFLDHAPNLTRQQLRRALANARRSGHLKPAALSDILDRNPTHPGHSHLTQAINAYQPTRSEFEDAFLRFCAEHHLPTPVINTNVLGYEVDALFPAHNLIVELDGYDFHRDRHSFEGDRNRDADTLAGGFPTVRITWQRLTETPRREARRLKRIMAGLAETQ